MADDQNVITPDTNSPAPSSAPTTNLAGPGVGSDTLHPFVTMLQQGMSQQAAAPPQYQPPPQAPAQTQPTFFGRLLQGALAGLAGGVKGGLEDVAAAGHGQTRGMGAAYGEQNAQQLQAQQVQAQQLARQQQQDAQRQAQQNFENANQTFQMSAAAQRDRALNLQSLMNAYKVAQEMDDAPAEKQAEYQKAQSGLLNLYSNVEHLAPLGTFNGLSAYTQWLQQNPNTPNKVVHTTLPNGEDQITVFPVTQGVIKGSDANAQLKRAGLPGMYPADASVNSQDFTNAYQSSVGKQADDAARERMQSRSEANQRAMEGQREAFEASQQNARFAHEDATAGTSKAAAPIGKIYQSAVTGAANQIEKIDDAKIDLNQSQASQGVAAAKIMTALVSGQGTGIRITMPELEMLMHAQGIAGRADAFIQHISGTGEFGDQQKQQLSTLLDTIKGRVLQKQQLANDHLNQLNNAGSLADVHQIDQDYRQKQLDMETGKIQVPRYRTSPDGKQRAQSTDGGQTWQIVQQ
jgi:hypothetical protein